jgi:aminopeptidase N
MTSRGLAVALASIVASAAAEAQMRATSVIPRGIDVVHYDFAVTLPESGEEIRGRATVTAKRLPATREMRLDLLLKADSVLVNGRAVAFRQRDGVLIFPIADAGDVVRATIVYHGSPTDGLIVSRDPEGRWQAFGDNWPNRGRHWLPLVDHPRDKATVTWRVNAPAALTVVANGTLADSTRRGDRREWVWDERNPVPTYVMVIAAAALRRHDLAPGACETREERSGCLEQTIWTAPEVDAPEVFVEAGRIASYFEGLVGPFPYEKLAHIQSSTRFGGMENASAIFYSDAIFRKGTVSARLLAHEIAHQWFGDAVTGRDWRDLWLSEGFATYFAELWAERSHGRDSLVAHMRTTRAALLADSAAVARRPVIDSLQQDLLALLNDNSYKKGSFVLHMLRGAVGDSAFFAGIRDYYARHRHGNATGEDLREAMERASGERLGWFFTQWLRRPGYPELATSWSYEPQGRRVYLEVVQGRRFGSFRFPLVVEVRNAGGATSRATVQVPAARRTRIMVPLELSGRPAGVTLDPDAALLARFAPTTERR